MKRLHFSLILSCVLFCLPAIAEQSSIKPKSQGEVTFISGGVGVDEQNALAAMRGEFNLSLLFSIQGSAEYLSGVKVYIADSSGNTFLETTSDGPKLFAKLKPGNYTVTADRDGQVIKKSANVRVKQRTSLSFTWP